MFFPEYEGTFRASPGLGFAFVLRYSVSPDKIQARSQQSQKQDEKGGAGERGGLHCLAKAMHLGRSDRGEETPEVLLQDVVCDLWPQVSHKD